MKNMIVVIIALLVVVSAPVFAGDIEIAKRYGVKDEAPTVSNDSGVLPGLPGHPRAITSILPVTSTDTVQVRELGPSFVNVENGGGGGIAAQVKELGPSFVNVENGGGGGISAQVKELGPSFVNVENGGGITAQVKK